MSFFFALVFMVLVFWRPQDWLFPWLFGFPLLQVVIAIGSLCLLVELIERRVAIPKGPVIFLLAGLLIGALMSHVAHAYFAGMVATFADVWKLSYFAIFLYCVTDRVSRLRAIAVVFVVLACVMSVHALMQQKLGYGFMGYRPLWTHSPYSLEVEYTRSLFFGIFEDPNDLAQILATAIPFAFVVTKRGGVPGFLLGTGISALLVSAIISTHSRGGQIGLAVVFAAMAFIHLPRRWMQLLLVLAAIGALALCPFAGPYLEESSAGRMDFWGQANAVFKQNPLFGVGYRMLSDYIAGDRAVHNAFVLCYSELGLFGYWFWFTAIAAGVVGSWRARVALRDSDSADGKYLSSFAGMAIAATASFLASSYFLSRAYVFPLFFLFATLNAVVVVALPTLSDQTRPLALVGRRLFIYGAVGTVGSIAYIYVSILLLNIAHGG